MTMAMMGMMGLVNTAAFTLALPKMLPPMTTVKASCTAKRPVERELQR